MYPQINIPPKKNDPGVTFLGMSGGILLLVISIVILFCVIVPILLCVGFAGLVIVSPTPSLTP